MPGNIMPGNIMPGKLTTHVLDTANGCPAAGLNIELWQVTPLPGPTVAPISLPTTFIKAITTNADGRTDSPLLMDAAFTVGIYELRFAVGAYFLGRGTEVPTPAFLDVVPIRFGIADATAHYHVPLLCSPWAYSTYRGS